MHQSQLLFISVESRITSTTQDITDLTLEKGINILPMQNLDLLICRQTVFLFDVNNLPTYIALSGMTIDLGLYSVSSKTL